MSDAAEKRDDNDMIVTLKLGDLRRLMREEIREGLRAAPPSNTQRWVDVAAAAKHFGRTTQTIRNWIRLGAPASQIGTSSHPEYSIELAEFEAWVRNQRR